MKKTNYRTGLAAGRYRSPLGEIDVVARRGRCVALVEVKARATQTVAAAALAPRQRERLARAAGDFLAQHPHFNEHNIRFDVMPVAPWRWPVHIADAWRP